MIETLRNILIALTKRLDDETPSSALAYGLSLAERSQARVTVQAISVRLVVPNAWISRFVGMVVAAENQRLRSLAQAAAERARSDAAAAGILCTTETEHLPYDRLLASFSRQARLHDVVVIDAEPRMLTSDRGLIETLLFESGRPLIVVPPGCESFTARRVLIAWDGSAQAARAMHDALPFLRQAEHVEIVSVVGEKDLSHSVPGAEAAPCLAHHGVAVTVTDLPAADGDVAGALRRHATEAQADMIVMGAFVHSLLREMVLGGVTQDMLRSCPVPLLMAH
ncbi:universal stress protein UspA [Methylobacterium variabile]|jgi:nucleotide-binding universal stress UspA family protein|uniref:Universal stress protein UspA n=1 Tax=Methylobacterium variabile TaxID=298794 RepID=A0A0J6VDC0_9HYPH|nr:universal stress protein [Methylobacterium variabile]KMO37046.1 universal stress protein UspA [Methylobacterium variabile]